MEFKWTIGIDVSKKTFDVAYAANAVNAKQAHAVFANDLKGFKAFARWLKDQGVTLISSLICLENTGIYHRPLVAYLLAQKAFVWVETPVQIKWSMGIQRGKSDSVDAVRISTYAFRNQDKAVAYSPKDESIQQMADLMGLRTRLMTCIGSLKVPIQELKSMGLNNTAKLMAEASKKSISALEKEIKAVEQQLQVLIDGDEKLSTTFKYATSVRSIGFVAALQLLVYTHGFTRFENAKQLASFCGIAPFEYSSGTSVRGKTKVHPMANKQLKSTLHMCAVSAIRNSPEMKVYYERKVAEGKNKMLVINAIRNKLVQRVFACVRDKKEYVYEIAA